MMSEHHKITADVVPMICAQRDCEHHALGVEPCPSEPMVICDECTRESWDESEGPATAWDECRIRSCVVCGGAYSAHWDSDHDWSVDRPDGGE